MFSTSMCRIIVFLAAVVLCSTAAFAGEPDREEGRENSLEPGSWSIQFRIGENFQLSNFDGSALSVKRHWSKSRAVRAGMSFGASLSDYESGYSIPDTSYSKTSDRNRGAVSGSITYLIYPAPEREVLFYLGVGPTFSYSRDKRTYQDYDRYEYNRLWSIGLGSVIGVEWFATRSISLLAEYTGGLKYRSSSVEDYSNGKTRVNDNQYFEASSSGVRLGLSAYF